MDQFDQHRGESKVPVYRQVIFQIPAESSRQVDRYWNNENRGQGRIGREVDLKGKRGL